MNEFEPRGYLPLEKALEYFGQLKHPGEWEAEKASSKQEFRQLLFAGTLSAKLFTGGKLLSLESSIWGGTEAEYIFVSGWATIRGGNEYFPAEVRGRVLIEQSSIDALFDGDSDDPSQSPEVISDGALTAEANVLGRPSLRTEIADACNKLIANQKAILGSRKPNYNPIRQIIRRECGLPPGAYVAGLGDEAIRKVIAPILDNALAKLNEAKKRAP